MIVPPDGRALNDTDLAKFSPAYLIRSYPSPKWFWLSYNSPDPSIRSRTSPHSEVSPPNKNDPAQSQSSLHGPDLTKMVPTIPKGSYANQNGCDPTKMIVTNPHDIFFPQKQDMIFSFNTFQSFLLQNHADSENPIGSQVFKESNLKTVQKFLKIPNRRLSRSLLHATEAIPITIKMLCLDDPMWHFRRSWKADDDICCLWATSEFVFGFPNRDGGKFWGNGSLRISQLTSKSTPLGLIVSDVCRCLCMPERVWLWYIYSFIYSWCPGPKQNDGVLHYQVRILFLWSKLLMRKNQSSIQIRFEEFNTSYGPYESPSRVIFPLFTYWQYHRAIVLDFSRTSIWFLIDSENEPITTKNWSKSPC